MYDATPRNLKKNFYWTGLVPQVFESLADKLNFTFDLYLSRDGNWGSRNSKTGQWNGLIKDLIDDVADIAAAPLTVMKSRSYFVDFLLPVQSDSNTFIMRKDSSFSWDIFFKPFHSSTWIFIVLFIFLISVTQALLVKQGKDIMRTEFTLEKCFIFSIGTFGGVSIRRWSVTPFNNSSR